MSFEDPTDEERPYVEAILHDLDDDGPRTVYADWLLDQGDPRGEFLHVQCGLAARALDDPVYDELQTRERALLKKHRAKWVKPLPKLKQLTWGRYSEFFTGRRWFHRGLVEHFTFTKPKAFELHAEELARRPARYVTFLDWSKNVARDLPSSPLLPRLRGLELAQRVIEGGQFPDFGPGDLAGLELFSAHEQGLDSAGLDRLLPLFEPGTLRALDLGFNDLGAADLETLVAWPGFQNLHTLQIGLNRGVGHGERGIAAGLARFVDSPHVSNLHVLDLWGNDLGPAEAEALAASPHLERLVELSLSGNRNLGDDGATAIAHSRAFPALRRLELYNANLGDEAAIALADSESSRSLVNLQLQNNRITGRGLSAIARSPHFPALRVLDLSRQDDSAADPAALRAFAESPALEQIEFLNLGGFDLDDSTRAALKKRFRGAFTDDPYASWSG